MAVTIHYNAQVIEVGTGFDDRYEEKWTTSQYPYQEIHHLDIDANLTITVPMNRVISGQVLLAWSSAICKVRVTTPDGNQTLQISTSPLFLTSPFSQVKVITILPVVLRVVLCGS